MSNQSTRLHPETEESGDEVHSNGNASPQREDDQIPDEPVVDILDNQIKAVQTDEIQNRRKTHDAKN